MDSFFKETLNSLPLFTSCTEAARRSFAFAGSVVLNVLLLAGGVLMASRLRSLDRRNAQLAEHVLYLAEKLHKNETDISQNVKDYIELQDTVQTHAETLRRHWAEFEYIKAQVNIRDAEIHKHLKVNQNLRWEIDVIKHWIREGHQEKGTFLRKLERLKSKQLKAKEEGEEFKMEIMHLVEEVLQVIEGDSKSEHQLEEHIPEKVLQLQVVEKPNDFLVDSLANNLFELKKNPEFKEVFEKYYFGDVQEKSKFTEVRWGIRKADNLPVAIKIMPMGPDVLHLQLENNLLKVPLEVGLMELASSGFECPGIIRLLESFIGTSTVLVVMELFEPCINLLDFINSQRRPLAENQAKGVFLQVVLAAHHCQKHGVFHGDIKPENLLIQVTTGQVKLSDFASGNIMHGEKYTSFTGTLIYAPPEWFLFQHFMAEHATVWSLGVTLYEMLCGYMPFMWVEAVVETQVTFTQELSVECQNLIKKCLAFNPLNRPTVKEILKHPWLYLKSSE